VQGLSRFRHHYMTIHGNLARHLSVVQPAEPLDTQVALRLAPAGLATHSIGIVLHDFSLGGTERIAVRLASQWAADGAEVILFVGSREGPLAELLDPRVRLVSPVEPIHRAKGSQKRLAEAAVRYFGERPVHACFVPGNYHWPVADALSRMPAAVRPVVAAQVSAALHKPQRGRLRQMVYDLRMRHLLRSADVLVTLCAAAGHEADAILRRRASVPIALPALPDRDGAQELEPARGRTILAAGRLVPEKGFDTLIAAFASLVRSGRAEGANLVIVGEGPDRARLTALIREHGLGARVSLPGYAPDIRPWLDEARLFVLPSRFEGYGAVIIEALAAGRPVIATRCTPAVDELLRGTGAGLDVPIDNPAALAAAIATMFDADAPDPARLSSLVDHHRIGPVARDYARLFRQIASERAVGASA
jgi:glycosyltransferase involved in cell wall biosynthesis